MQMGTSTNARMMIMNVAVTEIELGFWNMT
jgi:hypothetical protein